MKSRTTLKAMTGLVAAASFSASAALAQPKADSFNTNTNNPFINGQRMPSGYVKPPTEVWFDAFDKDIVTHLPTGQDKYVLTRDFGSPPQLERVVMWTNTAASVAKRYRDLARELKNMPLTPSITGDSMAPDLVTYKQSLAEWYEDAASVLEDYIRPRPPARTMEELQGQLDQLTRRSEQLKESMQHLVEMDSKLRDHFHVHPLDDAVWKYVTKPLPKNP